MLVLKKGSANKTEVKKLQSWLLLNGFNIGKYGADGIFGNDTEKAVEAFQESVNIKIDGEVGDATRDMMKWVDEGKPQIQVTGSTALQQLSLKKAQSQIGVVEVPRNSNRGKDVEKYLASINLPGGYAWCAAFGYWCVDEAAKELKVPNPLCKTGSVLMQWHQRQVLQSKRPLVGDIFIMDFGKGKGHCGFVEKVTGSYIHTVEGNTNYEGSREGDGVYRRKRLISSCIGFLRLDK